MDGCFETGVIKWRREKLMLLQFFGKNLRKLFSQNVFKDKDNTNLRNQNIDIKILRKFLIFITESCRKDVLGLKLKKP